MEVYGISSGVGPLVSELLIKLNESRCCERLQLSSDVRGSPEPKRRKCATSATNNASPAVSVSS